MISSKFIAGAATAVAIAAIAGVLYEAQKLRFAGEALSVSEQKQTELRSDIDKLGVRLEAEAKRARTAEDANAKLAEVADRAFAKETANKVSAAPTPVTRESVQGRYQLGKQLAAKGDFEAALKEWLWCYDEGMQQVPGFETVRQSELPVEIAQLGGRFPPALAALRERRDKAEERFLTRAGEQESAVTFLNLNRALKDEARTLQLYDQLPPGDPRRRPLARVAFAPLVAARRYSDASQGKSYEQMNSEFKIGSTVFSGTLVLKTSFSDSGDPKISRNALFADQTTKNIEVLAGAGDLSHATELAGKLLAVDSSDATKTLLRERLTRAGHSELAAGP